MSFFFLPIALRKASLSPRVKLASNLLSNITCSWYTVMPYVSLRYFSMMGRSYLISSLPFLRAMKEGM